MTAHWLWAAMSVSGRSKAPFLFDYLVGAGEHLLGRGCCQHGDHKWYPEFGHDALWPVRCGKSRPPLFQARGAAAHQSSPAGGGKATDLRSARLASRDRGRSSRTNSFAPQPLPDFRAISSNSIAGYASALLVFALHTGLAHERRIFSIGVEKAHGEREYHDDHNRMHLAPLPQSN